MKKTKKEKEVAFIKIAKCIVRCKTKDQLNSCRNMINNYSKLFKDHIAEVYTDVEVLNEEIIIQEKQIV